MTPDAPDLAPDEARRLVAATERWFLRRGTPHFIDRYRASEDVFTRTLPVLGFVVLVELLGAARLEWHWWQNALAVVGGVGVLVGAWAAINHLRDRPAFQAPDDVGVVELAAFVVLPAGLPLVFGGQVGSALATAVANLVVLVTIYLITSYGLVPMSRWALGQTSRQLGTVLGLFGRALPLLLLFSVGLFVNTEVWQVATTLDGVLFWTVVGFFVLIGLVFLLLRLPGEVGALRDQLRGEGLVDACAASPLAAVARAEVGGTRPDPDPVPLSRRQQGNVLLVLLFSQAVQIALVTVTITGFFLLFGLIAIRPEVVGSWLGEASTAGELARWRWFGHDLVVTRALLHVAGFLGALSGFYFTVYVITDATYRSEFFTEIVEEVRQSLAVRTVYLALVRRLEAGGGPVAGVDPGAG